MESDEIDGSYETFGENGSNRGYSNGSTIDEGGYGEASVEPTESDKMKNVYDEEMFEDVLPSEVENTDSVAKGVEEETGLLFEDGVAGEDFIELKTDTDQDFQAVKEVLPYTEEEEDEGGATGEEFGTGRLENLETVDIRSSVDISFEGEYSEKKFEQEWLDEDRPEISGEISESDPNLKGAVESLETYSSSEESLGFFADKFFHKKISRAFYKDTGTTPHVERNKINMDALKSDELTYVVDVNSGLELTNAKMHLDDLHCRISKALKRLPRKVKLSYLSEKSAKKKGYKRVSVAYCEESESSSIYTSSEEAVEPVVRTVTVKYLDGGSIDVKVAVYDNTIGIPWLGGYRNVKTGVNYIHATTQTYPRQRESLLPDGQLGPTFKSRDTQTHSFHKEAAINLPLNRSTQMWRTDHYMPADTDRIVTPCVYVPFDGSIKNDLREKAAVVIQKNWRRYRIQKYFVNTTLPEMRRRKELRKKLENDPGDIKSNGDSPTLSPSYFLDKVYPISKQHFYDLHWLLHNYKLHELKEIDLFNSNSTKKALNCLLAEKEVERLKRIQKKNIDLNEDRLNLKGKLFLEKKSVPHVKKNIDKQCFYLIDTLKTSRCRAFKEMFILFKKKMSTKETRLELLTYVKEFMGKQYDFVMLEEFLSLIDRECFFLTSGLPEKYIKGLRKRSEEILLEFMTNYYVKTESGYEGKTSREDIFRCKSCGKLKKIQDFSIQVNQTSLGHCKDCTYLCHVNTKPAVIGSYSRLLEKITKDEFRRGCGNPYACLLQPENIYEIVKIWSGKSIISGSELVDDLRLPRWDVRAPWTPWNCVLVTSAEAAHHETVNDLYEFYSEDLCKVVKLKHLAAKLKFWRMFEFEMQNRKNWTSMSDRAFHLCTNDVLNAYTSTSEVFLVPPPRKIKISKVEDGH